VQKMKLALRRRGVKGARSCDAIVGGKLLGATRKARPDRWTTFTYAAGQLLRSEKLFDTRGQAVPFIVGVFYPEGLR